MRIRIRIGMEPERRTHVEAEESPLTESAASTCSDSDAGDESAASILAGITQSIEGMLPILDILDAKVQSITATVEAAAAGANPPDLVRRRVRARDPVLQTWLDREGVRTCRDILQRLFDRAEWIDVEKRQVRLAVEDAEAFGLSCQTVTVFDLLRLLPASLVQA